METNFKKSLQVLCVLGATTFLSGQAFADDVTPTPPSPISGGSGTVSFSGTVLDTPCGISPDSASQTVNLGQIPRQVLSGGGKSTPVNFDIKLINCDLTSSVTTVAPWTKATVTFSGAVSTVTGLTDLLGTTGDASNIAIGLQDASGKPIKLATPTSPSVLINGNNDLRFAAYVQGSTDSTVKVVPGNFNAITNFTISYQ